MDASQYKDYVLVMLFMKYVSDKKDPLIELKDGTSFYDMLQYRGKSDIGDKINVIIGEFARNNNLDLVVDFNDDAKLGSGKDKIDRLTNLLNIFNRPELNFSDNRAEGDDLLGDAYEYLMRNFATESGKSKGQFYTPAEVSRVMAEVVGVRQSKSAAESLYDPTCGSGSLLLKAADLAPNGITIYGQENDNATRGLAVMNMWLHNFTDADIRQGNTMAAPQFTDEITGELKTFNYAVANPPFSYKAWMNGLDPLNDVYKRFDIVASVPPRKNGDYAFLLHIIKSLKPIGKACVVLPLGVLFRGNAEADIRKELIRRGYIKAVIGLPPNLFYGTGIAAALTVIDKEHATERTHIFMVDASRGFIKDGNKNRLRERDIHKIVDVFKRQSELPRYSRNVSISEITDPKNDYNLNIPRYIDSQEPEDVQDIEAHLLGGIPRRDVDALHAYWTVYPSMKEHLFGPVPDRPAYCQLRIAKADIKDSIYNHPEFTAFAKTMNAVFAQWRTRTLAYAQTLDKGLHPKQEIHKLSERLLKQYANQPLTDPYAMYQHLMDYWAETMQDDFYELAADGWAAGNEVKRIIRKTKKGDKEIEKTVPGLAGLEGRLIPPPLLISVYFGAEQAAIEDLEAQIETLTTTMDELREEHGDEDGLLAEVLDDKGKLPKAALQKRLKELTSLFRKDDEAAEELALLRRYKKLMDDEADTKAALKKAQDQLEVLVINRYPTLTTDEIKTVVIERKWLAAIEQRIRTEMDNISHRLTARIRELADRYETPLPQLESEVAELEERVAAHLKQMNFTW